MLIIPRKIIIAIFALCVGSLLISSETSQELRKRCSYLNSVRANYTACCKFPTMVAWGWDLRSCKEMCTNQGEEDERCCIQPCLYRKLGMLKENDMRIYWRGISQSFLLSVGNDSQWVEPVTSSCEECHKKNLPIRNASDCEVIPIQIYTIINCAYNTIYFKCPPWNPHNLKECDYTRDYIRDCF